MLKLHRRSGQQKKKQREKAECRKGRTQKMKPKIYHALIALFFFPEPVRAFTKALTKPCFVVESPSSYTMLKP